MQTVDASSSSRACSPGPWSKEPQPSRLRKPRLSAPGRPQTAPHDDFLCTLNPPGARPALPKPTPGLWLPQLKGCHGLRVLRNPILGTLIEHLRYSQVLSNELNDSKNCPCLWESWFERDSGPPPESSSSYSSAPMTFLKDHGRPG